MWGEILENKDYQLEAKNNVKLSSEEKNTLDAINTFFEWENYAKTKNLLEGQRSAVDEWEQKILESYNKIKDKVQEKTTSTKIETTENIDIQLAVKCANKAFTTIMSKPINSQESQNLVLPLWTTRETIDLRYSKNGFEKPVKNFDDFQRYLSQGREITPQMIPIIDEIRNEIINIRQQQIINEYKKILPPGAKVPWTMPAIELLATGDWSGTKWIDGQSNTNRWLFSYPRGVENKLSESSKKIVFGPQEKAMALSFTWFGENIQNNNPNSGWEMHLIVKKWGIEYDITGVYKNGSLTLNKWTNVPDDIVVDNETNTVTIPEKYRDGDITLHTKSAYYGSNNNYDEIAFVTTYDNAGEEKKSIASESSMSNQQGDFWWKFQLTDIESSKISTDIANVVKTINRSLEKPVSINFTSMADDAIYGANVQNEILWVNQEKVLKTIAEYTTSCNKWYSKLSKDVKIKTIMDIAFKNIDDWIVFTPAVKFPEGTDKESQIVAQKLLLKNRFLITLEKSLEDKDFGNALSQWTIKINTEFEIAPRTEGVWGKWCKISIPPYSYKKPLS